MTIGVEGQLTQAIDMLLESDRASILVDLTDVGYMDSVGIGELVAGYRTVNGVGGQLKILGPTEKVRSTLSLTRLLPIFEVFDDEEKAVASFDSGGTRV